MQWKVSAELRGTIRQFPLDFGAMAAEAEARPRPLAKTSGGYLMTIDVVAANYIHWNRWGDHEAPSSPVG